MQVDPWQWLAGLPELGLLHRLAAEAGARLWLCGGTIRDILLDKKPPDLDLAVAGDALALGQELAQRAQGRFVPLGRDFATCRVVLAGRYLDLAGLRASRLEADLAARDFTVNAMALPLERLWAEGGMESAVLDPLGGRADLAAGVLRPAGPGVLRSDPLRVLRAFRFMSTHGLRLAPGTAERLTAAGPGLFRVARERIGVEWLALMAGERAWQAVRAMDECQVLTRLVPELAAGRGLWQNPYHHLDVLGHSLACLQSAQDLALGQEDMGVLGREARDYLREPRRRALVMTAALLHDLGKPFTCQYKEAGWHTFYRHESVGAGIVRNRCRSLGLSRGAAGQVAMLVGEHMRPFHLMGAQRRQGLSTRAVGRLLRAAGQDLPAMFIMAMADTTAGKGPMRPPDAEERLVELYGQVAHLRDEWLAAALAAPPLIDGRELMSALGMDQGPEVGRLLALLREAQLVGEIKDKAEAIALARKASGIGVS